ncbi:MAG TPA: PTS sugar transporter subunit IIA [Negativicutes bacterium]|nr:PTS sugar transporter subunit IIA [Negativicutes bacterium]
MAIVILNAMDRRKKEVITIGKILDERLIVLGADVHSAEECILLMAALFEKYGYVKPGYGDAVVERERNLPTGLPGKKFNIAIPHTNNEFVIKPAVGVIIPREPVEFKMMGMKDKTLSCEIILPLVVKDSKHQIGMLKKMMNIIQDGELLQSIKESKSSVDVMNCLSTLDE